MIVVLVLLSFFMKAQVSNEDFKCRNKDLSGKERKAIFIENQKRLKVRPLDEKYLCDSSLYYQWNNVNNAWDSNPYRKLIHDYDDQGHVTLYKYYNWQPATNSWVDDFEYRYVWDPDGNLTEWIYNEYDAVSGSWTPYEHDTLKYSNNILISESWYYYNKLNNTWFLGDFFNYNNNGALTEAGYVYWDELSYIVQQVYRESHVLNSFDKPAESNYRLFDSLTNAWIYNYKIVSTYQNDTIIVNELFSDWVPASSSWAIYGQNLYSYTNNLKSEMVRQDWNGIGWNNASRTTYEYNPASHLSREMNQNWNGTDWDSVSQTKYTYDAVGNLTENLYQTIINGNWVNYKLNGYTFDGNNNQTERVYKRWNQTTGMLTTASYKYLYTFDSNNLNTQTIYQKWNTTNVDWLNNARYDNYYSLHLILGLPSALSDDKVVIYPNPVKDMLFINGINEKVKISVFDLCGRLIFTKQLENIQIDAGNFPNGLYMIKIETSKGVITQKFVKQ